MIYSRVFSSDLMYLKLKIAKNFSNGIYKIDREIILKGDFKWGELMGFKVASWSEPIKSDS